MRAQPENYKGIEFVRISALPEDQKKLIWNSLHEDKIIKILKDDCLLNDCVQFQDYQTWYNQYKTHAVAASKAPTQNQPAFKLAFK